MRISDWSSDVCSSDLRPRAHQDHRGDHCRAPPVAVGIAAEIPAAERTDQEARGIDGGDVEKLRGVVAAREEGRGEIEGDRKSVVEGKSVSVRVDLGGRRIIKKKKEQENK